MKPSPPFQSVRATVLDKSRASFTLPFRFLTFSLAMIELLLGASALFRHLKLAVNEATEDDMQIKDTFNGNPAAGKLIVQIQTRLVDLYSTL